LQHFFLKKLKKNKTEFKLKQRTF